MLASNTINLFRKTKIFLVGDIMLDRYVFGKVNRISPEAPVPIFLVNTSKEVLGGSGNVLSNLLSLGTSTSYLSIIVNYYNVKKIKKLLNKLNFKIYSLIIDQSIKTTVKTRYITNSQQIVRVDEENSKNLLPKVESQFIKKIDNFLKNKDVVVISDYNKGVITKRICEYIIKYMHTYFINVQSDIYRDEDVCKYTY